MVHLIDKDALIAEIKYHLQFTPEHINAFIEGEEHAYKTILSFIDSLKVKDVDLEKEIQQHIKDCLDIKFPTTNIKMIEKDVEFTARRFFKLGLRAQKEE